MRHNSYSDHPDLNDIFDEEPTEPFLEVTAQLNSAVSLVGEFSARAGVLGYLTEPEQNWSMLLMDEIADDLDRVQVEDQDIYNEEQL